MGNDTSARPAKQLRRHRIPFRFQRSFGADAFLPRPAIPVTRVADVAILAMQVSMHPVAIAIVRGLRQGMSAIPVALPIGAQRLPNGRFRITAEAAITPDDPSATTDVQVEQMARKLSAVYERWIREQPQQWMAMARRWPKALELESVARAKAREA